jgi:hypothetical protein
LCPVNERRQSYAVYTSTRNSKSDQIRYGAHVISFFFLFLLKKKEAVASIIYLVLPTGDSESNFSFSPQKKKIQN